MESCTFRAKSVYRSPLVFFLYRHGDWSRFALPLIALRSEIWLRFELEESLCGRRRGLSYPLLAFRCLPVPNE